MSPLQRARFKQLLLTSSRVPRSSPCPSMPILPRCCDQDALHIPIEPDGIHVRESCVPQIDRAKPPTHTPQYTGSFEFFSRHIGPFCGGLVASCLPNSSRQPANGLEGVTDRNISTRKSSTFLLNKNNFDIIIIMFFFCFSVFISLLFLLIIKVRCYVPLKYVFVRNWWLSSLAIGDVIPLC